MRAATAVLLLGLGLTALLTGLNVSMLTAGTGGDPSILLLAPGMVAYATLGWFILRHRPGHRIGWVLLATVPLVDIVFLGFTVPVLDSSSGLPEPLLALPAWLAVVLIAPAVLLAFPALGLLFPDGHLPGRGWRWPAMVVTAMAIAASVLLGLAPGTFDPTLPPNPFGLPFLPEGLRELGSFLSPLVILLASILAVASMAVRVRRSRAVEREQMKWMLGVITVVAVLAVPTFVGGTPAWWGVASSLSLVLIPGAAAVAILRYRLYDIDRLVSRTIGWALVTGVLVTTFLVPVLGLQALVSEVTQGETLVVAVSTLLAAALFQPLRGRVQRAVDRRFDRARYDAERVVALFGERLREQVDLDALDVEVRRVADTTVRPTTATIWLRRATKAPAGPIS